SPPLQLRILMHAHAQSLPTCIKIDAASGERRAT
ncbi:MAG: hypothetical protein QOE64_770, partial [Frankiales bacterium]|nr:hypothetical protein [Frankiales bacterium]